MVIPIGSPSSYPARDSRTRKKETKIIFSQGGFTNPEIIIYLVYSLLKHKKPHKDIL